MKKIRYIPPETALEFEVPVITPQMQRDIDIRILVLKKKFFMLIKWQWLWCLLERYIRWNIPNIVFDIYEEGGDLEGINSYVLVSYGIFEPIYWVYGGIPITILVILAPSSLIELMLENTTTILQFPEFLILMVSLITVILLMILPVNYVSYTKAIAIVGQLAIIALLFWMLLVFDLSDTQFQFQFKLLSPIDLYKNYFSPILVDTRQYGTPVLTFMLGVDGLNVLIAALTGYLFLFGFALNWNSITDSIKESNICLHLLQFFIYGALFSLDIIWFYIFFEATLIPLFLLIGVWGSREQKVSSAYKLFFYTLISSSITLIGFIILLVAVPTFSSNFIYLEKITLVPALQMWLFWLMFLSFAVKLPIVPLHNWLPEAHVEAPTVVSMILAGVLLKLGGYGMCRFLVPLVPDALYYFQPILIVIGLVSIFYAALLSLRSSDLKKIVAYSSISHMGFITLALANINATAVVGIVVNMVSHGFISSALFAAVGVLYDRYKTRNLLYFGGLATTMPVFSVLFLILSLANAGFPGLSGFSSELITLAAVFKSSPFAAIFASLSIIFSAANNLWLFVRMFYGKLSTSRIPVYQDISLLEFITIVALLIPSIVLGSVTNLVTDYVDVYSETVTALARIKSFFKQPGGSDEGGGSDAGPVG